MRSIVLFITLMVFFLSYGPAPTGAQEPSPPEATVQAPVYKDGEWWVYRLKAPVPSDMAKVSEEYRITYKNGKFESDEPDLLTSPSQVNVHLNDPKRKWLDFPLIRGKKWSFQYSHTSVVSGRFTWRDAEAEVIGPVSQPVKTAAGKFKVIKIRRRDTYTAVDAELIYFYSPEAKSVVKLSADYDTNRGLFHWEMELIKYSVR